MEKESMLISIHDCGTGNSIEMIEYCDVRTLERDMWTQESIKEWCYIGINWNI